MEKHRVIIDTGKCIGCGKCVSACAAHNLVISEKKAKTVIGECVMCGHCTAVCPKKAISISGYTDAQVEKEKDVRLNPDEVLDVIRFRRSIRKFQEKEIPRDVLEQILEAGRLTHTAKNLQDVSFVVLEKEKDRFEQMAVKLFKTIKPIADLVSPIAKQNRIDRHFFFFKAPAVVVVLARDRTNGILAAQNMEFVAEAHGLGVLFSGFFSMSANALPGLRKALQIPKGKRVAATLVLGYPAVNFLRSAQRKELDARFM